MRCLVLTGASGRIGSVLREGLRDDADELRLADRHRPEPGADSETCVEVDLGDFRAVLDLLDGADAVLHLAAVPTEVPFPRILDNNIRASFHVLEGARRRGVSRVVLASSNHATGMYPVHQRIGPDDPPRPDSFYGVGKVCDEALGRLYAEKFGLEVACLRIGSFQERPTTQRALATWLSHGDALRLVRCCLTSPDLGFAVLYGVSANRRGWWDNPDAERLGYRPVDDAEEFADEVAPADLDEPARSLQGGPYTPPQRSVFDES